MSARFLSLVAALWFLIGSSSIWYTLSYRHESGWLALLPSMIPLGIATHYGLKAMRARQPRRRT